MNKEEILAALELLKDSVNDPGKQTIDGIKAAVFQLQVVNVTDITDAKEVPDMAKKTEVAHEEEKTDDDFLEESGMKEENGKHPKAKSKNPKSKKKPAHKARKK